MAGGLIVAAGLLAYCNSFGGPFIFDGIDSIVENPSIRRLWPPWQALSPPAQGQAVQRRPIVNLSLAVNYALGGLQVKGYHQFNLAVHILTGLVLFGILHRTLLCERLGDGFGRASWSLALVCALIWLVHPLQTNAVTYTIQRTEVLGGLFYLLSLYCVIRGAASTQSLWWYVAAVLSCLLGMGSKEIVVSAPLVIFLYDRLFLSGSFKEVVRRRWGLYVGLAATWGLLVALISYGAAGAPFGVLDYAPKQFAAISNYLRLCFCPAPLILDYGRGTTPSFLQALPYALFIIMLLAGTVLAIRYKPAIGFLGVWFFSILAPSSSFTPLNEWAAEKRMYLPLAAVVIMVILCGYILGKRLLHGMRISDQGRAVWGFALGYSLALVIILVLGWLSVQRNHAYRSEFSIWDDTVNKQLDNWRAFNNRGNVYSTQGRYDEAIRDFNRTIELNPRSPLGYNNRGIAYYSKGDYELAISDYAQAIELNPKYAKAYSNRGLVYYSKGDYDLAIRDLNQAIALAPNLAEAYNNRGLVYRMQGKHELAISDYAQAVELNPQYAEGYYNRGLAYRMQGKYDRAIRDFKQAIELNPKDADAHKNISEALIRLGRAREAVRHYRRALELRPDWLELLNNLAWILATHEEAEVRNGAEAVELGERACRLVKYKVPASLDTLAAAYAEAGEFERAVKTAETAIQLARDAGREKAAKQIESHLKSYRSKRPWRESFGSNTIGKPESKR